MSNHLLKTIKRYICLGLCGVLVLSMCACGSESNNAEEKAGRKVEENVENVSTEVEDYGINNSVINIYIIIYFLYRKSSENAKSCGRFFVIRCYSARLVCHNFFAKRYGIV